MNNTRYSLLLSAGGIAGFVAAIVLLLNAAKRASFIPTTAFTQLVAPVAQLAAIVLFIAIVALAGASGWRLIAGLAGIVSLASLVGVEFVINLVFAEIAPQAIGALRAGPLGIALTVASMGFLITTIAVAAAWFQTLPKWALLTYAVGSVVVALRAFVPEIVLDTALVAMAVGVVGISTHLLRVKSPAMPEGALTAQ